MQRSSIEVLEAADSYDLVTLEAVKAYLQITTTVDDARLRTLITFASKVISDLCDRVFALERVTETINTVPSVDEETNLVIVADSSLLLSRYPVREIESCLIDGSDTTYVLDVESGVLRGAMTGDAVITYSGGYELPDEAPGPLSMACIDLIRQTYYYGNRDPMIQSITDNASGSIRFFPPPGIGTGRSSGGGSGAQRPASPLSPTATALILPYRRIALA